MEKNVKKYILVEYNYFYTKIAIICNFHANNKM